MAAPNNMITAADYADAMMVARSTKGWLFLLLLLMLLFQLAVFFVARYTNHILPEPAATATAAGNAATAPTAEPAAAPATRPDFNAAVDQALRNEPTAQTAPATRPATSRTEPNPLIPRVLRYVNGGVVFLTMVLVVILLIDLLLIINIMLVGRLVGVSRVTSAWVWCVVLALMLIPWQTVLYLPPGQGDFQIPGVLYSWSELIDPQLGARFDAAKLPPLQSYLRWARFAGAPGAALLLLLIIRTKSSRGLRAALGESELESTGEMTIS